MDFRSASLEAPFLTLPLKTRLNMTFYNISSQKGICDLPLKSEVFDLTTGPSGQKKESRGKSNLPFWLDALSKFVIINVFASMVKNYPLAWSIVKKLTLEVPPKRHFYSPFPGSS